MENPCSALVKRERIVDSVTYAFDFPIFNESRLSCTIAPSDRTYERADGVFNAQKYIENEKVCNWSALVEFIFTVEISRSGFC